MLLSAIELNINMMWKLTEINKVSPRARRDDMPPADGSSTVAYRFAANQAISRAYLYRYMKTADLYVRPRTGPQSAHLCWPAMAKLQAASVSIA